MKFLTLLEIELKKILPILSVLFGGGLVLVTGLFYSGINDYKKDFITAAAGQSVTDYVAENGAATLNGIIDQNMQIVFAMILIALLVVMSGFYLWYKEWFGQSKRIYMLLTLKGSRFTIFLSKLCVIVLSVILYYGFVFLCLGIGSVLMNVILPEGLAGANLVQGALMHSFFVPFALPLSFGEIIYELGFVVMMFSILSTFVMLDRSKRVFGMIAGVIYGVATIALFIYTKTIYLFQDEVMFVNWGFVLVVTLVSTVLSAYLLNKKVSI